MYRVAPCYSPNYTHCPTCQVLVQPADSCWQQHCPRAIISRTTNGERQLLGRPDRPAAWVAFSSSSKPRPVPTTPVSAVPALFATVRARPGPFRPVKTASRRRLEILTGRNGPGRARTVANRAGTALTGAVRTGPYSVGREQVAGG